MGGHKRTDEILVHQISLPARRDYQLRSCSPLKTDNLSKISNAQLVARAFQNARALSFNASHNEIIPYVLDSSAPNPRSFYSGPLPSKPVTTPMMASEYPNRATVHHNADEGHAQSDESVGGHSDDLSEVSREHWDQLPRRAAVRKDHRSVEPYIDETPCARSRWRTHSQKNPGSRAESVHGVGGYISLTPARRAMSGDLRESKSRFENRAHSIELTRAASSCTRNRSSARSGEIVRGGAPKLGFEKPDRSSESKAFSEHGGPVKKNIVIQSAAKVNRGGQSKCRPTASTDWDSLNKSQDSCSQHELAAIPFKWEEAPGKPISNSIAAAAERAMAKRFLREVGHKSGSSTGGDQRTTARRSSANTMFIEDSADSSIVRSGVTSLSSPNGSFRSSHRFYARTAAPGDGSFGPRKSVEGAHIISEVENNPHIDLVAPAAAKFLVESWVSPGSVTPEPNLTTTIPFQWEEAPGIPKLDGDAIESSKAHTIQLQLPPRLVAPLPPPPSMSKEEIKRGRQQTRSMSGPLASTTYPHHSSPSQRQHSPPVMRRSCSPSKRSISPSRIQALAKHFSRKAPSPLAHVEDSRSESSQILSGSAHSNYYRHSYTCGNYQNSGPLEEFDRDRGRSSSNRAIGRSGSGVLLSEMAKCNLQDGEPGQMRSAARSFASGPLDYGGKPKRHSSPSQRSDSPSRRIHALAKHLISKIRTSSDENSTGTALDSDLSWPVSVNQVQRQHSYTRQQSSDTSLFGENFNPGAASDECSREGTTSSSPRAACADQKQGPWSPTSILQSHDNDPIGAQYISAGPSSGSSNVLTRGKSTDPVGLSKSLSRVSYESFEHSFAERESPSSTAEDAGGNSPFGSPYLGPTSGDFGARKPTVGAAESVKAIVKMCRSSSTWRRSKTHSPEMWAPTLASYFQCLEATLSNPVNAHVTITQAKHLDGDNGGEGDESAPSVTASDANEAQTRLPYTLPTSQVDQNLAWKEHCHSPKAEIKTCLGLKLSPARFITRGSNGSYADHNVTAWGSERHLSHSIPTNTVEDGYRSPAYAATLELLSPSVELFRKKRNSRVLGSSRGVKFIMPSPSMRRKTQLVEAMCKSLKRALYKCAKRCCRKTMSREEPVLPETEFSFYKPN